LNLIPTDGRGQRVLEVVRWKESEVKKGCERDEEKVNQNRI
jgi:hypothetical protein